MRGNELLDKMELIDPAYIEAADTAPNKRKSVWICFQFLSLFLTVFHIPLQVHFCHL